MSRSAIPDGCIAFAGGASLYGDGEDTETATRDVEVLLSGQYKTRAFSVDQKQFSEMIANHQAANVDPVVDREHESWFSEEATEARGWVKSLRVEQAKNHPGRTALVATVEFNDLGLHALKNKHFRYLSAGINLKGKNPLTGQSIGAVLDHVALVKNPYVQGMEPLSLSTHTGDTAEENRMEKLNLAVTGMLGLSADVGEEAVIEALTKRAEADKAELVALRAQAEAGRVALTEGEKLAARVQALETEKLTGEVDAAITAFKLQPAEREAWIGLGKKDADMFRRLLAVRQPQNPTGPKLVDPKSSPRGDRESLQLRAVDEHMKANTGVSYEDAILACAAKNPELFSEVA